VRDNVKSSIPLFGIDKAFNGIELQRVKHMSSLDQIKNDHDVFRPHRDDHYMFFFQETGNTELVVDFENIKLEGQNAMLLLPNQVHQVVEGYGTGWILAVESEWLEESLRRFFQESFRKNKLPVDEDEWKILILMLEGLEKIVGEDLHFAKLTCQAMVNALVARLASAFSREDNVEGTFKSRQKEIVSNFRNLLSLHYKDIKTPSGYAQLLHVTPNHLNDCVKKMTGMPVTYWIRNELILETKRLLFYTSSNVKEIAHQLKFDDEKYLHRLFKNVTGETAGEFRARHKR
jgi:AraC family transcriptional regulator, transcriptional activator of pobA